MNVHEFLANASTDNGNESKNDVTMSVMNSFDQKFKKMVDLKSQRSNFKFKKLNENMDKFNDILSAKHV
jgi:hypothetical protein